MVETVEKHVIWRLERNLARLFGVNFDQVGVLHGVKFGWYSNQ
jgi:hypothetical protein